MNIKKFLEKVAEEDRESLINDKDIEFLASIGVDYNKKREQAKKQPEANHYLSAPSFNRRAIIVSIACFLVAVFAVLTILYFTVKPGSGKPPIGYLEDNFLEEPSDLNELNKDLQLFSLVVDENEYTYDIQKTYDSVSNHHLFYTVKFASKKGQSKKFSIDIVVNGNFDYDSFEYTSELKESQVSGYTLKYTESVLPMFMKVNCKGEIQIGEQYIYITNYEETAIGQSTLVETLESLISFK